MRKTLIIALGAAVALVTAAVAVAVVPTAVGVSEATATFSTSTVERLKARECTGADGKAFRITDARYTGTMVSANAVLAGPLTIHARTTFSTSDSLGYVEGSFRVKDDDSRVSGRFSGTLKGGKLVGFLTGTSRGNHARVLGNLSATFDPAATTAFTGGALGSGSSGALAVIAGPVCRGHKPSPKPAKPKRLEIHGTLSLGTGTVSVTRGALTATCTIDGLALAERLREGRQGRDEVREPRQRLAAARTEEGRAAGRSEAQAARDPRHPVARHGHRLGHPRRPHGDLHDRRTRPRSTASRRTTRSR